MKEIVFVVMITVLFIEHISGDFNYNFWKECRKAINKYNKSWHLVVC